MSELYDARFKTKSTITIAGPTQSGKTTLVENIVKRKDVLFTDSINDVYWYCAFLPKVKLENVKYTYRKISRNVIQYFEKYLNFENIKLQIEI